MENDGVIVVGTKLSTEGLEKDLKKLNKQELEDLKIQVEIDKSSVKEQIENLEKEYNKLYQQLEEKTKNVNSNYDTKGFKSRDSYDFSKWKKEYYDTKYSEIKSQYDASNGELAKYDTLLKEINTLLESVVNTESEQTENIEEAVEAQKELTKETEKTAKVKEKENEENKEEKDDKKKSSILSKMGKTFKTIGVIGAVIGGATLGLIGAGLAKVSEKSELVKESFQRIKQIVSNVAEQLVAKFQPTLERIADWIYKLFVYIGYILNAWFGIDVFAKSTSKSLNDGVKSAKALRKQLLGFDEMNILNKDTGSTGAMGATSLPALDISDVEIPDWIKWIAENKETILDWLVRILATITTLWLYIKGISLVDKFLKLKEEGTGLFKVLKDMSGLQIFGLVAGISITLVGIISLISDLITGNTSLVDILKDVGIILSGISIIIISITESTVLGWIGLVVGAVMALTGALFDDEFQVKDLTQAQKDLNKAQQDYISASQRHLNAYDNLKKAQQELTKVANKYKISTKELMEEGEKLNDQIVNEGRELSTLTPKEREIYETYLKNKDAQANLVKTKDDLTEANKNQTKAILDEKLALFKEKGEYKELGKAMQDAFKTGAIKADELSETLNYVLDNMDDKTKEVFTKSLPGDVSLGVLEAKTSLNNLVAKEYVLKFGVNTADAQQKINNLAKKIKDMGSIAKYALTGGKGYARGGIINVPKLAVGGIINRPGRGIPLASGGAIGGERGPEAVVPLTDTQQMELLGQTIGKYININATIPVQIGNRQVAREIKRINADESFAYNG